MHIITKPLTELKPAPYNPRLDLAKTDPRYRKLRRSLRDFGLVEPLVWNRRTGHVVGGHQRLKILRELKVKEAPVSVVDLPPEREKALNLVLNNREAQADWDVARLEAILTELAESALVDFQETGFEREHLEMLRARSSPVDKPVDAEQEAGQVEIALRMSREEYETLRPGLDELLRAHEVECHVRCR
jgi:ParB-like chromosome segregation protein Spo0J